MTIALIGATGLTGSIILESALKQGMKVRALVRNPSKLTIQNPNLTIIQGDVLNQSDVEKTVGGCDAVISALGVNTLKKTTVITEGMRSITNAMKKLGIKRVVAIGSAGMLNEIKGLPGLIVGLILKNPLKDHFGQYMQLKESELDWTIIRPLTLTNTVGLGKYRVEEEGVPARSQSISRADVAAFILKTVTENSFIGKSPAIGD